MTVNIFTGGLRWAGLGLALSVGCATFSHAESAANCHGQTRELLTRLQAEVIGQLDESQLQLATDISLDICDSREQALAAEKDAAVREARQDEQENAASWWQSSPNKEGNQRLKRRGGY